VLLLLGVGTNEDDIALLLEVLNDFRPSLPSEELEALNEFEQTDKQNAHCYSATARLERPPVIDQVMVPRAASMAPAEQVAIAEAENFIAAECIAPCPPGIPLCVPGQRLTKEVLNQIPKTHVRIVQSPQPFSKPNR
jgi:arginine/lysine/ornithine decarboxylase